MAMHTLKSGGFAAIVITGAILLSGCEPQTEATSPAPVATDGVQEVVAATVNGSPIYLSDVQLEAEAQGATAPGQMLDVSSALFTRVLNSLIDDKLLAQQAQAKNLDKDPFVEHRIQVMRSRILGNALLNEGVDEVAIQKYYETAVNLKQLQLGEEYRVRQIVLPSRGDAEQLLRDMTSDTDFAVLASDRSIDEVTRMEGGDLGFINPDTASPELSRAILNTPIGAVSKPFETNMGWHVIKVVEKRPEPLPSLAELRPQIRDFLIASELERLLKKLHKDATIIRSFEEVEGVDSDPFDAAPVEAEPPETGPAANSSSPESSSTAGQADASAPQPVPSPSAETPSIDEDAVGDDGVPDAPTGGSQDPEL